MTALSGGSDGTEWAGMMALRGAGMTVLRAGMTALVGATVMSECNVRLKAERL
jgi:hypothetical protein